MSHNTHQTAVTGVLPERSGWGESAFVVGVDVHVVVGQVVGPDGRLGTACMQVDVDVHLARVMSTSLRGRPAPPFSQMRTPLTSTVTAVES